MVKPTVTFVILSQVVKARHKPPLRTQRGNFWAVTTQQNTELGPFMRGNNASEVFAVFRHFGHINPTGMEMITCAAQSYRWDL